MSADPFATAQLRARVLSAWAHSAARFREDANVEEDYAHAYGERLVFELAQNAADAAVRAGAGGRLRLSLADGALVASNTGAPLDAAGVESLCTMRASAKRGQEESTGRFGVGFAAVLAVTDMPEICSRTGSVRWSRSSSRALVRSVDSLGEEVAKRHGQVPLLRLPFAHEAEPEPGFDTTVRLVLRDDAAERLARRELMDVDPTLLLALPALACVEVVVDGRTRAISARRDGQDVVIDDDGEPTRWRLASRDGRLPAQLLADRPIEERARRAYSVTVAVPVGEHGSPVLLPGSVPAVFRAPTPTAEPSSLPAVIVASLPVEPTRHRVVGGPLRDFLLDAVAAAYAELAAGLEPSPQLLDLVPTGLGAGELDAVLRARVLDALREAPFLVAATGGGRLRPADAVTIDFPEPVVEVLADVVPGLLPAAWSARLAPLAVLGVRRLGAAELVDALRELRREPGWWRTLYAAFDQAHLGGPERDALAGLPVPLVDGRLVSGARGVFVPTEELAPELVAAAGLRVADPAAAHPLLRKLGAVAATPSAVLADPRLRAAVESSYDDMDDPGQFATAVLGLVAAAGVRAGEHPWLAELALPGADGEIYPAGELLLPDSPLADVMSDDAPFGVVSPELVEAYGRQVLTSVGVLDRFSVLRATDVPVDADLAEHDLDGEAAWLTYVAESLPSAAAPAVVTELVAVRDLELVRADAWPQALAVLDRSALTDPAVVVLGDGRRVAVLPYTRWWLRCHPVLGGRLPVELRVADADPLLAGLYDDAPGELDPGLAVLLGVRTDLSTLLAEPGGAAEVLDRLADAERTVSRAQVRALHARLAVVAPLPPAPRGVRAVRDGSLTVVAADDAVVCEAPDLRPLVGSRAVAPAPLSMAAAVADLLDLSLAGELVGHQVESAGRPRSAELPAELGVPTDYLEHARLAARDADGERVELRWRVIGDVAHVSRVAEPADLARALAWRAGRWGERWIVEALLRDPKRAAELLAESDLDDA